MPTDDRFLRPARVPATGINWLLIFLLILVTALLWRDRGGKAFSGRPPLHDLNAQERPIVARGELAERACSFDGQRRTPLSRLAMPGRPYAARV